jgi:hypothetical protein
VGTGGVVGRAFEGGAFEGGAFEGGAFEGGAFEGGAFLAVVFLAVVFLAVVFLAVVFLAFPFAGAFVSFFRFAAIFFTSLLVCARRWTAVTAATGDCPEAAI